MAPEFAMKVADLKCDKLIIQWSICNLRLPNIDFEKLGAVITIQSAGIPKKIIFNIFEILSFAANEVATFLWLPEPSKQSQLKMLNAMTHNQYYKTVFRQFLSKPEASIWM